MLVDIALGGAQAFLQSERPSSMSHHVLLRIDIALTQHGNVVSPSFLWRFTTSTSAIALLQSDKAPHAYGLDVSRALCMCCSLGTDCIPSCLVCPLSVVIVHNMAMHAICSSLHVHCYFAPLPLCPQHNAIAGEAIHQWSALLCWCYYHVPSLATWAAVSLQQ